MNKKYESLSKNALKCMRIASIFGNLFLGVLIIAGYLFLGRFLSDWIWILLGVIVLVISVLDIFVVAPIRFRRYQYAIDEECIDIMEGFLRRSKECNVIVPFVSCTSNYCGGIQLPDMEEDYHLAGG